MKLFPEHPNRPWMDKISIDISFGQLELMNLPFSNFGNHFVRSTQAPDIKSYIHRNSPHNFLIQFSFCSENKWIWHEWFGRGHTAHNALSKPIHDQSSSFPNHRSAMSRERDFRRINSIVQASALGSHGRWPQRMEQKRYFSRCVLQKRSGRERRQRTI